MKIRIQGDSVRFRLSKSEVGNLVRAGRIADEAHFGTSVFRYEVVETHERSSLSASFESDCVTLYVPAGTLANWDQDSRVGFSAIMPTREDSVLKLILEKDFKCLDNGSEDQSDFYENPKMNC